MKRVPADEEGMKGENFAEALVFDVAAGHLPDGAVGAEADEVGSHPKHIGEMGERLVGEFDEGALEDGVGLADELAIALEVVGSEAAHLVFHVGLISRVFEGIAVVPDDPIKGMAGDDLDVVGSFLLVQSKELIEKKGSGEDGGAGVVGEPLVDQLLVENQAVAGVRLRDGETLRARVVVSNADVANFYRKKVSPAVRQKWTDRRLEKMRYSMSLFLIYFGTNRTYPELAHHTIWLGPRYKGLLDDIFHHRILAEDFSLYLHAPTRTDPSLAPKGHECFYVLSPVPHLGAPGDQIDWEKEKESYADRILAALEKSIVPDLRKHLVSKIIFTPRDFESRLDAFHGSAFQFEPILTQSAWFRPHNVSEDVEGLYLCGAGTHPGAGVPGVLSSAKLLDRVIPPPAIVTGKQIGRAHV